MRILDYRDQLLHSRRTFSTPYFSRHKKSQKIPEFSPEGISYWWAKRVKRCITRGHFQLVIKRYKKSQMTKVPQFNATFKPNKYTLEVSPRKSWGCKTIVTDRTMSWTQEKKIFFNIFSRIFENLLTYFLFSPLI